MNIRFGRKRLVPGIEQGKRVQSDRSREGQDAGYVYLHLRRAGRKLFEL